MLKTQLKNALISIKNMILGLDQKRSQRISVPFTPLQFYGKKSYSKQLNLDQLNLNSDQKHLNF